MTRTELNTLSELLLKLRNERLQEYRDKGWDIDSMDDEELIEFDDGDNLLEGIEILIGVVEDMKSTKK